MESETLVPYSGGEAFRFQIHMETETLVPNTHGNGDFSPEHKYKKGLQKWTF